MISITGCYSNATYDSVDHIKSYITPMNFAVRGEEPRSYQARLPASLVCPVLIKGREKSGLLQTARTFLFLEA